MKITLHHRPTPEAAILQIVFIKNQMIYVGRTLVDRIVTGFQ